MERIFIFHSEKQVENMTLLNANISKEYIVRDIQTDDEELNSFLFSLGCYSGEPITVISRKKRIYTLDES